jgi:hypothetical protein
MNKNGGMTDEVARARASSMNVLIEVNGAPDYDHPDRQHKADGKCHEHFLPSLSDWPSATKKRGAICKV